MAMRSRLAALGVDANHEDVARRLDAWDAQVATSRRKHGALSKLLLESEQQSLPLGTLEKWDRPYWPSNEEEEK